VRALDQIKVDGRISQEEFYRLYDPAVLAAGLARIALKPKVIAMWAAMTKDASDGQVERLACWDQILADKELCSIVGSSDVEKGTAILQAMKDVKALDQIKQDGRISQEEFYRLYDPDVLAAGLLRSNLKPKVIAMWTAIGKDPADGQVERLACWDIILADKELSMIVGSSDAAKGTAILEAMKEGKVTPTRNH
jgi:hypothetical protein